MVNARLSEKAKLAFILQIRHILTSSIVHLPNLGKIQQEKKGRCIICLIKNSFNTLKNFSIERHLKSISTSIV